MSVTLVADILLILFAVAWILFKQVQPAPVKIGLLIIVPVLLAYFGITTTASRTWSNSPDLLLIVLGAAISVGLGVPRDPLSGYGWARTEDGGARGQKSRWPYGGRCSWLEAPFTWPPKPLVTRPRLAWAHSCSPSP